MKRQRTRMFIAGLCVALALPVSAAAADPGPYVALGDSYTAAPLVLNLTGRPFGCLRSDRNYPSLVSVALDIGAFTDVSCSAARTNDMTGVQTVPFGVNAPQFDGLRDDTRLVTVGIGANDDVSLLGAAITCVGLDLATPIGSSCRDHFAPGGVDRATTSIANTGPKIAAVLAGIHERSPQARIALVGYPAVLPRGGNGCYPIVPLSPEDIRYLDSLIVRLNAMLAEQAAANGAEFVDTYTDSIGHDVCSLPGAKWFEFLVPTALAFPMHPNASGMRSMARSVARVLAGPPPAPVLSELTRVRRIVIKGRTARFTYRLDRGARVDVVLQRAATGRRSGARCAKPNNANRGSRACRRSVVARRLSFAGIFGPNNLAVGADDYARRPGLYSVIATPVAGELFGAPQVVRFRVRDASRSRSPRRQP